MHATYLDQRVGYIGVTRVIQCLYFKEEKDKIELIKTIEYKLSSAEMIFSGFNAILWINDQDNKKRLKVVHFPKLDKTNNAGYFNDTSNLDINLKEDNLPSCNSVSRCPNNTSSLVFLKNDSLQSVDLPETNFNNKSLMGTVEKTDNKMSGILDSIFLLSDNRLPSIYYKKIINQKNAAILTMGIYEKETDNTFKIIREIPLTTQECEDLRLDNSISHEKDRFFWDRLPGPYNNDILYFISDEPLDCYKFSQDDHSFYITIFDFRKKLNPSSNQKIKYTQESIKIKLHSSDYDHINIVLPQTLMIDEKSPSIKNEENHINSIHLFCSSNQSWVGSICHESYKFMPDFFLNDAYNKKIIPPIKSQIFKDHTVCGFFPMFKSIPPPKK